jgi:hypothetical protein
MKVYNPNAEERAFLYQEAQSLEPLIRNLGSLTVLVEEVPRKSADERFRVTFVVAPENGGMRIQATDANIYDATMAAKAEAERQLNHLLNSVPRSLMPEAKIPLDLMH